MPKKQSSAKLKPGQPGYVGRGYPPEHGKIRVGETRNPWGRKGKPREDEPVDFAAEMAELLARPVQSKDGQFYKLAPILLSGLMKGASAGDVRAIKLLIELTQRFPLQQGRSEAEDVDAGDEAILEHYRRETLLSAGVDPDDHQEHSARSMMDPDLDGEYEIDDADDDLMLDGEEPENV